MAFLEKRRAVSKKNAKFLEKQRQRSPYLRTEDIVYENPPSLTNFNENLKENIKENVKNSNKKPIHVNMSPRTHASNNYRMFFCNFLNFSQYFFIKTSKHEKSLEVDELEKAFSKNYSAKLASFFEFYSLFLNNFRRSHESHEQNQRNARFFDK